MSTWICSKCVYIYVMYTYVYSNCVYVFSGFQEIALHQKRKEEVGRLQRPTSGAVWGQVLQLFPGSPI